MTMKTKNKMNLNNEYKLQNDINIKIANNKLLTIAKASCKDTEKIINFLNMVGGETDFLTFGLNEFTLSLAEEKKIISKCLKGNNGLMLVGKIENEIVAQLFLQRVDKARLAHIGDIGISVSKKYWGHSIGRYMMLVAIEWAKRNGITKLQLQVRTDNKRATQLYASLGFVIEGNISRAMKIKTTYFDDYLMGLLLDVK